MIKRIFLIITLGLAYNGIAQTAEEYYDQSYDFYAAGKYKDCINLLDMAIRRDAISEHYLLKAQAYEQLAKYDKLLETLNDGLAMYPDDPWLYNERGYFYQRTGKADPAIRDYSLAIKFAGNNDSLVDVFMLNRGTAKSSKRDFEGAYEDYVFCYNFDSTDIGVLNNLAVVCDEVGRDDEVLMYLHKVIEVDTTAWFAYGNIGFAYQQKGDYEKSIEYFDIVLKDNPEEAFALSNKSYSNYKLGNLKAALKDVNKSIELLPANAYAYRNRALIYIEMGKTKKACSDMEMALQEGFTQRYGKEVINLQKKYCH